MLTESQPLILVLHIPKTAGTTLNSLFYANYLRPEKREAEAWSSGVLTYVPEGIYHLNTTIDDRLSEEDVRAIQDGVDAPTAKVVLGHFEFGLHRAFSRPTSYVTLLRDPVERIVSLYSHFMRWEKDGFGVLSKRLSLKEFGVDPAVANDQIRRISGLEPASASSANILRQSKTNLRDHFSLVGVTERFDEFLALFGIMLGWRRVTYVPRQVNPRRADAGVSPAERDAIEKTNALDRQLYEYACELLDRKVEEAGARFRRELTAFRHENANFIEANARRRVDLNHAPMKELCTLPGVGPTIAQRIVEYRELRGGFRTVKELARIRGIGPSRRWRLLDRVIP